MTKIKNNATQQLNNFVVKHFEATETNSSANTINEFAELVLGWFNETLKENESIVFETIENQIFTMAKYNRGGLKDASGFLKQEINRTFENNVKSAVQLAHIWYSKENKDMTRNTKQSKYFYIANNKMNVKSIFGTIGDTLTGLFGILTGLVGVGIMSQVVFGTGWMGIDVVGNISNLVNTFLTGGVTGLLTLIVLFSLIDTK